MKDKLMNNKLMKNLQGPQINCNFIEWIFYGYKSKVIVQYHTRLC